MDDFNRHLETAGSNFSEFASSLPRAVQGLTGLTDSFRSFSRTITAVGAGLATILPGAGLPIAGLGIAGMAGAGALSAGMGLAGAGSPNGLQSVDKAFDILAGTIGGVLQPAFVLLGGLALMGADAIREYIKEHKAGIINTWATAIEKATVAVQEFGEWMGRVAKGEGRETGQLAGGVGGALIGAGVGRAVGGVIPGVGLLGALGGGWLGSKVGGFLGDPQNQHPFGAKGPMPLEGGAGPFMKQFADMPNGPLAADKAAPAQNPFLAKLADKMDMLARDIATSVGKPSMTDPVSKFKEVALAISQSEMEARKIAMQRENLDLLRDIIRAIRELANPGQKGFVIPPWAVLG